MKKISFAVPCYNSASYMRKCIDSLLIAGEDAEIIIVNDGSNKDNTQEIALEYAEKYPEIVRVINKENGGHGDAVTSGIKNATGKYFKVVDSDDWLDQYALKKYLELINSFDERNSPDAIFTNYVYEHVSKGEQKYVSYRREFPKDKLFTFDQTKAFAPGKFITMHSLTYKTSLLQEMGLSLPKHTYYVDNVFICKPLLKARTFYYLDVDLYRYFIGRNDQSVNESVIMKNIDQHIAMTKVLIDDCDINPLQKTCPKLYRYLLSHLSILFTINSIYLIKINTPKSLQKKKEFWEYLQSKDAETYKKCKRKFVGLTSYDNAFIQGFCKVGYTVVRKIFKFN